MHLGYGRRDALGESIGDDGEGRMRVRVFEKFAGGKREFGLVLMKP